MLVIPGLPDTQQPSACVCNPIKHRELGFEMPRGFLEEQSQSKGFGLSKRGAAVVATSGSTIGTVNSALQ